MYPELSRPRGADGVVGDCPSSLGRPTERSHAQAPVTRRTGCTTGTTGTAGILACTTCPHTRTRPVRRVYVRVASTPNDRPPSLVPRLLPSGRPLVGGSPSFLFFFSEAPLDFGFDCPCRLWLGSVGCCLLAFWATPPALVLHSAAATKSAAPPNPLLADCFAFLSPLRPRRSLTVVPSSPSSSQTVCLLVVLASACRRLVRRRPALVAVDCPDICCRHHVWHRLAPCRRAARPRLQPRCSPLPLRAFVHLQPARHLQDQIVCQRPSALFL